MNQFWRGNECFFVDPAKVFAESCVDKEPKTAPLLVVWGDSYAASLLPGLLVLQKEKPFRLAQFTIGSCPPILDYNDYARTGTNSHACAAQNLQTFQELRRLMPDVLVISGNWTRYRGWPVWSENSEHLENTISQLKRLGLKKVVLLGVMPAWPGGIPNVLYRNWKADPSRELPFSLAETDVLESDGLREMASKHAVKFVSPRSVLCQRDNSCIVRLGDTADDLTMWSDGHLSPAGSKYFVHGIAKQLLN